jgi:hypothetical protein
LYHMEDGLSTLGYAVLSRLSNQKQSLKRLYISKSL